MPVFSMLKAVFARLNRPAKSGTAKAVSSSTVIGLIFASAIVFPLIFWCMGHLDPLVQRASRTWPRGLEAAFQYITEIGRSGWTLWPLGLFIVFALLRFSKGPKIWADRVMMAVALRAWFIFFAVAGSGLIGSLVKNIIGRARPPFIDSEGPVSFHPFAFQAPYASFPSGHAITAVATATALWLLVPKYRLLWIVIGFAGAFSRVIVNAHYITDVLIGSIWGLLFTLLTWRAFARRALVFQPHTKQPMAMSWRRLQQGAGRLFSR